MEVKKFNTDEFCSQCREKLTAGTIVRAYPNGTIYCYKSHKVRTAEKQNDLLMSEILYHENVAKLLRELQNKGARNARN